MDFFETHQGQLEILLMIGLATILGGAIGLERELEGKPAGLRTHMLVAGTAALFVALGTVIVDDFLEDIGQQAIRSDPVRIIQAIVTGISFLGAGTIIQDRSNQRVEGLTTAASVLFAAGIGATIAVRQYTLAIGAVMLVLFTLRVVGLLEKRLNIGPKNTDDEDEDK